jgi:proton glutamate symport protein
MRRLSLPTQIAIGMLVGILVGAVFADGAVMLRPIGDLFLRLIRLVVVPLVFSSLLVGTATVGDPKKLGRIGGKTMLYYLCTTAIAIVIGLVLANVVQPGAGIDAGAQEKLVANFGSQAEGSAERLPNVRV